MKLLLLLSLFSVPSKADVQCTWTSQVTKLTYTGKGYSEPIARAEMKKDCDRILSEGSREMEACKYLLVKTADGGEGHCDDVE